MRMTSMRKKVLWKMSARYIARKHFKELMNRMNSMGFLLKPPAQEDFNKVRQEAGHNMDYDLSLQPWGNDYYGSHGKSALLHSDIIMSETITIEIPSGTDPFCIDDMVGKGPGCEVYISSPSGRQYIIHKNGFITNIDESDEKCL